MQKPAQIATTPEQIHELFVDALHTGDLDQLMALYEPDAAMMPEPGRVARGARQRRQALQQLVKSTGHMTFEAKAVVQVDELAYIANKWTKTDAGQDGNAETREGVAVEVVRRGPDGGWRFVIGNPWGDRIAD